MKTAIAIDSLIHRDESIFLLELVLNLFPNSEIYTIAHKQGGILGPVETRPIVSSFLSHKAKDITVFNKYFWLLPSAVKGIPLHPSIEKVIVISRGFIHGLNIPDHVEKHLYILDWDLVKKKGLFGPFVTNWREKALRKFLKIAVSSEALKNELHLPNAEVIQPTFRTEEYPFVKDEDHNFDFTHHLVHTQGLDRAEFQKIVTFLTSKGETVRVLGPDEHLKDVKGAEFGGDHCEATSAVYSHAAKAVWDLSNGFFPSRAFGALCTGRPVIARDSAVNREYLTSGTLFVNDVDKLEDIYNLIEQTYATQDRKVLRRAGLKWNERLFKSRMVKFLNS